MLKPQNQWYAKLTLTSRHSNPSFPETIRSDYEIAALIAASWSRCMLVHVRNVPLAQHQAGATPSYRRFGSRALAGLSCGTAVKYDGEATVWGPLIGCPA